MALRFPIVAEVHHLPPSKTQKSLAGAPRFSIQDCWNPPPAGDGATEKPRRCLRCGNLYTDGDNSPFACAFHGHTTGEKGLFALAPPHQGIDGEWSDKSGVIVYKWNEKNNRPNTGSGKWKKRWSCCAEYDQDSPPCRRGWHVSYDDGFTMH